MILVTGATGKVGGALLEQMHSAHAGGLRGLTRSRSRAAFPPSVEVAEGDLTNPESLAPALDGVRALFLVPGSGGERELVDAAREKGVEHLVLLSSLVVRSHPEKAVSRGHRDLEEHVRKSGLAWTVLRPTQFAANTLWWADTIREHRVVRAPYPDVGLPAIHPADIAAVARAVLTEPGHHGRCHPLTGPDRVTPRQQATAIAAAIGCPVTVTEISRAEAHEEMSEFLGADAAHDVLDVTGGDLRDELLRVHDTVPRLTGNPGRTFARWAVENATSFR